MEKDRNGVCSHLWGMEMCGRKCCRGCKKTGNCNCECYNVLNFEREDKGVKRGEKNIKKENERSPLLPTAQSELDQKIKVCQRAAYHAEAFNAMELINRGMKMQAIRSIAEHAEVLEKAGFTRLEDFFDFLGINARTGYRLKKIAEAFSDEELTQLQSMGLSQRGILKLASLPPGQLPDLKNADDPAELKATINALIKESQDIKDAALKVGQENEKLHKNVKELKARLPHQHGMDWAWLNISYANQHISNFHSSMNLLLDSKDHRLVGNPEFKARMKALYETFYRTSIEVFHKINELFGCLPEEGSHE